MHLLLTLVLLFQDIVGLTDFPVPPWPAEGVVPASMKDTYVFLDLAKNEYVVAYPENLGTENFAKDPGKMRINRYALLRDVQPEFSVTITKVDADKLRYTYTITNGASAKQSIDSVILALSEASVNETLKAPQGWFSAFQKGRKFKLRNPEFIRTGAAAIWSFEKMDQVISPGSTKKGFDLESDLRPGFAVAFLRKSGATDAKTATQGNVPKEVKEQLDRILQLEYNSRTVLTIGPKFDKSADDYTIAQDYIQGIFILSRAGILDLNSDFVRNTLSDLTALKPGAAASGVVKLATPAKTPAETDVINALKLSLQL
jgi:hypothetical protein